MLMQAPIPPDIVQIGKLIATPEGWDGNTWGDLCSKRPGENDLLSPSNSPVHEVRPIIKTEVTTGPWGGQRNHNQTPALFDQIQMAILQEHYSHKPAETETEYLWQDCLSGGDRVLLSGEETKGFWGPASF